MQNEPDKESFLKTLHPEGRRVGTFGYLWKRHRTELLRLFISGFRERPLLAIFLTLFFVTPSLKTFVAVMLAFIISQLINEILGQFDVLANQHKVAAGAIVPLTKKFDDLTVSEHKISEYMSEHAYADMSHFLVEGFQRLMPIKRMREQPLTLNDTLSVYVFDTDQAILENVSSYPAPLRHSYIIHDHTPEECGHFQRFTILHETGHVILGLAKNTFFGKFGFSMMMVSLGIGLLTLKVSLLAWLFLFAYYLLGYKERLFLIATEDLRDEVFGDTFALSYLETGQLRKLNEMENLAKNLRDPSLSPDHNDIRLSSLQSCLDNLDSWIDDPDVLLEKNQWLNHKPKIWLLIVTVSSLVATSLYVTIRAYLLWKLGIVAIVLLITFFYTHVISFRNTENLRRYLETFQVEEDKLI